MTLNKAEFLAGARLAAIAYDDPAGRATALGSLGLQEHLALDDAATSTQGFIASNEGAIVVVMRGTQQLEDWITNVNVVQQRYPGAQQEVGVHHGFWRAAASVRAAVEAKTSELLRARARRVVMAGHSLGGALVTVLAPLLKPLGAGDLRVFTYGSPRAGSASFASFYRLVVPDTLRFVHDKDIVPRVPKIGYAHVPEGVFLDGKGGCRLEREMYAGPFGWARKAADQAVRIVAGDIKLKRQSLGDHAIDRYLAAIEHIP